MMRKWRIVPSCGVFRRVALLVYLLTPVGVLIEPTAAYCQFNVSLEPHVAEVEMRPGGRGVLPFRLTNQDMVRTMRIAVSASDIVQGARGQYLLSDTAMPYSCLSWLTLPDTLIEIGPGESREVPVEFQVPFGARGGGYGAVVFEMLSETPGGPIGDPSAIGVDYRFQLPAWIEITVKTGRAARGRLTPGSIEMTPTADISRLSKRYGDRGMVVSASVENTGNIHVFTKGRVIIRDENRRLVRDTRLGSGRGAVLPGVKTKLQTIMKLPPPGSYSVKAIVEYGGRSPAIAQSSFEVTAERKARTGESEIALPLWIDLRPDRFEPSVPVDGFRVFGVSLMNREDGPVEVDVELGRIQYDENGQMWVSDEGVDSGRSCAQWLTIEPRRFVLDPQRRKNVRITLNVPKGVSGGYYSCVVINSRLVADTGAPGLPTPMYCPMFLSVPPDLEHGGEIVNLVLDQPGESAVGLNVEFRNTGNIHQVISGAVKLEYWVVPQAVEGLAVTDTARFEDVAVLLLETDSTYVLPGETRSVTSQTAEGLPAGRYRARIAVSYGGQTPATSEREFVIKAPEDLEATGGLD